VCVGLGLRLHCVGRGGGARGHRFRQPPQAHSRTGLLTPLLPTHSPHSSSEDSLATQQCAAQGVHGAEPGPTQHGPCWLGCNCMGMQSSLLSVSISGRCGALLSKALLGGRVVHSLKPRHARCCWQAGAILVAIFGTFPPRSFRILGALHPFRPLLRPRLRCNQPRWIRLSILVLCLKDRPPASILAFLISSPLQVLHLRLRPLRLKPHSGTCRYDAAAAARRYERRRRDDEEAQHLCRVNERGPTPGDVSFGTREISSAHPATSGSCGWGSTELPRRQKNTPEIATLARSAVTFTATPCGMPHNDTPYQSCPMRPVRLSRAQ
jgi:hypothetical protein